MTVNYRLMGLEIQLCHHRKNFENILKYSTVILICNNISQYYGFALFLTK